MFRGLFFLQRAFNGNRLALYGKGVQCNVNNSQQGRYPVDRSQGVVTGYFLSLFAIAVDKQAEPTVTAPDTTQPDGATPRTTETQVSNPVVTETSAAGTTGENTAAPSTSESVDTLIVCVSLLLITSLILLVAAEKNTAGNNPAAISRPRFSSGLLLWRLTSIYLVPVSGAVHILNGTVLPFFGCICHSQPHMHRSCQDGR